MNKVIAICFALVGAATASDMDFMPWWEYYKVCTMAKELVIDSKRRIHQTDNIRNLMANETGFQVGVIMGKIRDKYSTMLELYRLAKNQFVLRPWVTVPGMRVVKPLYYIVRMEIIHHLEVEIDSLVRVLEALPPWDLEPSMKYAKLILKQQMQQQAKDKQNTLDPQEISKYLEMAQKQNNMEKYKRSHQQTSQDAMAYGF